MPATIVVGGQFGDEGKGKIVAYLSVHDKPAAAVRGGVGPNAGHTVSHNGKVIKLRMLPSAVINQETRLMIGAGVLVDPRVLLQEIETFDVSKRVVIDRNCGIIEQKHLDEDRRGHLRDKIETTGTGTGPAQADRAMRTALLANDVPALSRLIGDVSRETNSLLDSGKLVLIEGTQGTFLSLYHGTYPFVTSKDVTASAICSDVGIGPKRIDEVLIVYKAYTTRVGGGPLREELTESQAQKRGWSEVGTVTGRVRRAAPLDYALAKEAAVLNSPTQIAVTKLDILFPECRGARKFSQLGYNAQKFTKNLEDIVGLPITLFGTGEDSQDIIDMRPKQ